MTATLTCDLRPARSTDAGAVGAILSEFVDTTPWMSRIHSRAEELAFAGRMIDLGWVTVAHAAPGAKGAQGAQAGPDAYRAQGAQVDGFIARRGDEIVSLYMRAAMRGQGIGSRLIQRAQAEADQLTLWCFQNNIAARRFYHRHGFVEFGRSDGGRNDEGLPDICFTWQRNRVDGN